MYETEEKAITSYTKLSLFVKKIEKIIGSHLSMATLADNEGLCTETDSEGHFDFHVFENVDLSARFQVIKPLK